MRTTPKPSVDIAQLFPELAPLAKETVRLHPRRGPEPGIAESKVGGTFLWPADEPWPVCPEHNDFYVTVIQIRAEEVPEVGFPDGKNLFQLLWCPEYHDETYTTQSKIFWRNTEEIQNPLINEFRPKSYEEHSIPTVCYFSPEKVLEYPSAYDNSEELDDKISQWEGEDNEGFYERELSVAEGTKIGGHAYWIQAPQTPICNCGQDMEHLLTVASWEFSGMEDSRWCPIEDKNIWTTNRQQIETVRNATGLMLGDAGSIYYFICRHCKDWPIEWVFQCS